jgi:hypothetical protein
MSREQILELLKLLSALEAWSFADKHNLPDFLLDRLDKTIEVLTAKVLD